MNKAVLHHISSDFGKKSSIGFRSKKIYEFAPKNIEVAVICRSNKSEGGNTTSVWTIDLSFAFSRLFILIKSYFKQNFHARKYELFIFNILSIPYIILHYFLNIKKRDIFILGIQHCG